MNAPMGERAENLRLLARWYLAFAEVASGDAERRWRSEFAEYLEREAAAAERSPAANENEVPGGISESIAG